MKILGVLLLLTAGIAISCGGSSSPAAPTNNPPASTAPVIASVTPSSPTISSTAQTLTVTGTGFALGMTLVIISPSGGVATSTSAQMQSLSATSFQVSAILAAAGVFTFQVTSASGEKSNSLSVTAQAAASQSWTMEGALLTDVTAGYPGRAIADVSAFRLRDGRWRLLFAAGGALRSAISTDGLSLTMEPGSRSNDPCGAVRAVPLDDGRTRVFCSLPSTGMKSYISSDEGLTLTLESAVLISNAALGVSSVFGEGVVRMRDGRWRMYIGERQTGAPVRIMSATSTDLQNWSVDAGTRIGPGTAASGSAEHPSAIVNADGSVSVFYFRFNPVGTWVATSADGLSFSTETNIFSGPTPARNDPDVVALPDGSLRMYFNVGDGAGGTIFSARRATGSAASYFSSLSIFQKPGVPTIR